MCIIFHFCEDILINKNNFKLIKSLFQSINNKGVPILMFRGGFYNSGDWKHCPGLSFWLVY